MIKSPCISVCDVNEVTGYCRGCFRTMEEIANWLYYDDEEKKRVISELAERRE